jgi:hypothetical protein
VVVVVAAALALAARLVLVVGTGVEAAALTPPQRLGGLVVAAPLFDRRRV